MKRYIIAIAAWAISAPLWAQDEAVEAWEVERQHQVREVEARMREAEIELEEAARRVAELSAAQLARAGEFERQWIMQADRPVIGITIGGESNSGPVEGVAIDGISPGGAAEAAGLLAGDIITAVNGEPLSAENSAAANRKLLDFMAGVEVGDTLDVEYLRNNRSGQVSLSPKAAASAVFDFSFDGEDFSVPVAPDAPQVYAYRWISRQRGHGFGDMEMVELNESLGRYFGTDTGLLIVKAPTDNIFNLQDGDVILSIDGRQPKDLHHAVRILSSYERGETVNFEIMRDKRKQTVTVAVPDERQSMVPPPFPREALAATPVVAPRPGPAKRVAPAPPVVAVPEEPRAIY